MKTLFKPFIVLLCAAVSFSSCMKDTSAEDEARQREQEEAFEALLASQEDDIEQYRFDHPSEAPEGWQEDEREIPLPTLGRAVKTGIWFEVLAEPTEEDDEAYEYKYSSAGGLVTPTVEINYRVSLLDGTEVQSGEDEKIDFSTFSSNTNVFNELWVISFFPKSFRENSQDIPYIGLTAKGLKKGSHIRVVTPSVWAFGEQGTNDIPANSPLVYEFEVLSIE